MLSVNKSKSALERFKENTNFRNNLFLVKYIESTHTMNIIECTRRCLQMTFCESIGYRSVDDTCILYNRSETVGTYQEGWINYVRG